MQMKTMMMAAICAATLAGAASEAQAFPAIDPALATPAAPSASIDHVWYRCGYYGCRRRYVYRRYYRPYRYYGYYYRPRLFGIY